MPFDVFAARSVAAFATDGQFVEHRICVAIGKPCGRSRATGVATDAVIGDTAAEAAWIIGFITGRDVPAGLL